jgi:hypothetical protein
VTLTEQTARPAAVSATFVVTADDLVGMSRMAGRDGIPFILVAAITFVGIGLMLWGHSAILGVAAAIFGVLTAAVALVPGLWRFWLMRQASDLVGEERHFVFDDEGFHEERAGIRHTTPWSAITLMRLTRDGIYLLRHGHVVLRLPARAFASPDDVDRLIGIVSAHASNVRVS